MVWNSSTVTFTCWSDVSVFVLQMIPLDSFVGQSADGKMVPIIPGGNSIPLTFSNRKEYVERAIEYRLHEIDRQVRQNLTWPESCGDERSLRCEIITEDQIQTWDQSLGFHRLVWRLNLILQQTERCSVVSSRCCRLDKAQKDVIWQKYLWFKGSVHSKYKNLFLSWPRLI